ncbi:MAG TPA: hypothetical protein VLA67_14320 [Nitrospiraceae bacterium]|nr:hypothetical protein [Nitrospiraceae bacterium]
MQAQRRGVLIIVCLLAVILEGCPLAWRRLTVNEIIRPDDVSFIVPGTTTLADVVKNLGAPGSIRRVDSGTVVRYHFLDIKYFTVNVTRPLSLFFPILEAVPSDLYQLTYSGGGLGTEELQVEFDKGWVVVHYAFAHHQKASSYIP